MKWEWEERRGEVGMRGHGNEKRQKCERGMKEGWGGRGEEKELEKGRERERRKKGE